MLAFVPSLLLIAVMLRWSLGAGFALYANIRMLLQLLGVGYVLTYVLETDQPIVIAGVIAIMIGAAAWIALRPLKRRSRRSYFVTLGVLATTGLSMLTIVTQFVLDLPSWIEPRFVVPLAGMIFANSMNTLSLAAERFEAETSRDMEYESARRIALEAALIPQVNALLAVGLVALPGMMTGQILSGIEPMIAVRYQIIVMCMTFGSAGLSAALYLVLQRSRDQRNEC